MRKVKIVVHKRPLVALLKGPEIKRLIDAKTTRIAATAGPGMETDGAVGRNRYRGSVRTATFEARKAEASNRALSKALDAGR